MALIIEVVDRAGTVRTRVRVADQPITIGRGYDNDVIVDDAYVDARHARVHMAADGTVVVEDLGSINGLVLVGGAGPAPAPAGAQSPQVAVQPGTRVRIGRTILHFRDPAEPVEPALHDIEHGTRIERFMSSVGGRVAVGVGAIALVAWLVWLGSYTRESSSTVLSVTIGIALVLVLWCGAWAVAGRVVVHRFNFAGHYTIASLVTIAAMVLAWFDEWLTFLFPANPLVVPVGVIVLVALATASIAMHLGLASHMSRFARWRAAGITIGVVTVAVGLMSYAERNLFSDVPEFNGVVKSFSPDLLPSSSVDEFSDVVAELVREVDALAVD